MMDYESLWIRALSLNTESQKKRLGGLLLFVIILTLGWGAAESLQARVSSDPKDHILIVYNKNAKESKELAYYYAKKRGISKERILEVDCPNREEISREEFREKIFKPIEKYILSKGWLVRRLGIAPPGKASIYEIFVTHNDVRYMVLMRGMPLKIAHDPSIFEIKRKISPLLNNNGAAVDSELALLPVGEFPIYGPIANPYFSEWNMNPYWEKNHPKKIILVTRLDANTPERVREMIEETIQAELVGMMRHGVIDERGISDKKNPYSQGDRWLKKSVADLKNRGWVVDVDKKAEIIPRTEGWDNVSLYGGWYSGNADGPFMKGGGFSTGAIGYHIYSYSASSLRGDAATLPWCGALLHHGAVATMGAVYEPYLDTMPHWDIFVEKILQGANFAEAAYMSQKVLSWMITIIGDPLYRPCFTPYYPKKNKKIKTGSVIRSFKPSLSKPSIP